MTIMTKPGQRAAAASMPWTGAFKPEAVGQRAFNLRARGSTPPGSSNRTITTHD